jgi:PAS domain S-box-containing protein
MKFSRNSQITFVTLLITIGGVIGFGSIIYSTISETITNMAADEMSNLLSATSSMLQQSTNQAIINHLHAIAITNLKMVEQLHRECQTGRISEAEAKKLAEKILLGQKIGVTGYIYCIDSRGFIKVHPYARLVNTDMHQLQLAHDQMRLKSGYLEYFWKNPGEVNPRAKALYMCYFAPWDWIISVSSYRSEFNSLIHPSEFKKDILSIHIGPTGYLYILDGKGNVIVHPQYPEGQNVADLRDVRGDFFMREILKNKTGKIRYWWKSSGEAQAREKVVLYKYFPALDWIIAAGVYSGELYAPLKHVRNQMVGTLSLTCLFVLVVLVLFGRGVMSVQKAKDLAALSSLATMEKIIDSLPVALIVVDRERKIQRVNGAACNILKAKPETVVGQGLTKYLPTTTLEGNRNFSREVEIKDSEEKSITVLLSEVPVIFGEETKSIAVFLDISERRQMEIQLRNAQKLEAVGQLAAGIAHEINTPIQYIGDNVQFLEDVFKTIQSMIGNYQSAIKQLAEMPQGGKIAAEIKAMEERADIDYIQKNTAPAFQGALDGISKVTTIVRAMKEFAHPDGQEKVFVDINRALEATLTIARNEYKYVAEVETDLREIPEVLCHASEINQAFLNIIINASHAIGEVVEKTGGKGLIKVSTEKDGPYVRIEITDTGAGIPEEIRERVYDPFFTTKAVGKGTGQGLAIARSIVVDKHHGRLTFTSEVGKGTFFFIMLPINYQTPPEPEKA